MLELVSRRDPRFVCSGIEGNLPFPSYTIDTLHTLMHTYPQGTHLFFIIGVDAFLDFATWKSYREILRLVDIVIASRHGYSREQLTRFLQSIGYFWHDNSWRDHRSRNEIHILRTIPVEVSSTSIRRTIREGKIPTGDILPEVLEYIVQHQLYQADGENPHPPGPR